MAATLSNLRWRLSLAEVKQGEKQAMRDMEREAMEGEMC